ncbi:MAG TPA: adenylate/guanylate cyclase domain-containing protein [Candidatus Gastranaerophilaceae bacterium]|nr:adenylate/guanylate cyclase domain-containing protein [Candidatus Gastranaerophilaceae bacterium]
MKRFLTILGLVLIVIFIQVLFKPFFNKLEWMTYDLRARFSTDKGPFNKKFNKADKKIVLISIDDYSRKQIANHPELNLGAWPWRRNVWGEVLNYIEQGHPRAVLLDIVFNDISRGYDYDNQFAQELKKYNNVVLATSLNNPKYLSDKIKSDDVVNSFFLPTKKPLDVENFDKQIDYNITYLSHAPIYNIYTEHNTMGVVNKVVGTDSIIRKVQPIFKLEKNKQVYYIPSLAFAGFLKYMGEGGKITIKHNKIFYKNRVIPIDDEGTTLLSWHGKGNDYTYIPISKIFLREKINGKKITPNFFKDKIVIIGRTEAGTDIHASAVNPTYAGPEANAAGIDNFINDTDEKSNLKRKFISQLPPFIKYEIIIFFCLIIAFIGLTSKNAIYALFNSLFLVFLYLFISFYAFAHPGIRLWIPIIEPLFYILLTTGIILALRLHKETTQKREIMNMFGKFVSPNVLSTIIKNPSKLVLKNSKKRVTILFCDVKDFTSLSEKYDPQKLVDNLNELFNEIVNIIFKNNGTVDKFIGDSVMAYWGDPIASPDDAYMAVKTALEIKKKVNEMKLENAKNNKIIFDVKIGINTGDALLGLSGSNKIMSYTAMGDAVNTASRLESACSKLKKDILISKSTYEKVKEKILAIYVDKIEVKGKDEQIEVYEPVSFVQESLNEV